MSTTKTYKIEGLGGRYSIFVRYSGKGKLVQFNRNFTDLTFTTSDSELQAAIEATNEFKSKLIVIDNEIPNAEPDAGAGKKANAGSGKKPDAGAGTGSGTGGGSGEEVVEEVTTIQGVKDWLKQNKQVAPVAMNSLSKLISQVEKAGVSFPNVVWPEE